MAEPKTNLKVAVRIRPLNSKELSIQSKSDSNVRLSILENTENHVWVLDPRNSENQKIFEVDWVFSEDYSNIQIFDSILSNNLEDLMEGFNVTMFAYGMTGAGKSYTVFGTERKSGLLSLAAERLINLKEELDFGLTISMLEIYNERIKDLLSPISRENLMIVDDPAQGVVIPDLSEVDIVSKSQLYELISMGNSRRTTAETGANVVSSRSHAICIIKPKLQEDSQTSFIRPKLQILDLAGSERAISSNNMGMRHQEGGNINRSLLALGKCIAVLSSENRKGSFIPYRDSKLTRLLKDSLGGNTKSMMIACVSPSPLCYEETLNTLKYATMAKKIVKCVEKVECEFDQKCYQNIIENLKAELQNLKSIPPNSLRNYENIDILSEELRAPESIDDEDLKIKLQELKFELFKKNQWLKSLFHRFNNKLGTSDLKEDVKEFHSELIKENLDTNQDIYYRTHQYEPKNFVTDVFQTNSDINSYREKRFDDNLNDLSVQIRNSKYSKFPKSLKNSNQIENIPLENLKKYFNNGSREKNSSHFGFEVTERYKKGEERIIRVERKKKVPSKLDDNPTLRRKASPRNKSKNSRVNAKEDYSVIHARVNRKDNPSMSKHHASTSNIHNPGIKREKENIRGNIKSSNIQVQNVNTYNQIKETKSKMRSITSQGGPRNNIKIESVVEANKQRNKEPLSIEYPEKENFICPSDDILGEFQRFNRYLNEDKSQSNLNRGTSRMNRNRNFRKFLKDVLSDIIDTDNASSSITMEKVSELQKFRVENEDLIIGEEEKGMLAKVDNYLKDKVETILPKTSPQKPIIKLSNDPYKTPDKPNTFLQKFKERTALEISEDQFEQKLNEIGKLSRNVYI